MTVWVTVLLMGFSIGALAEDDTVFSRAQAELFTSAVRRTGSVCGQFIPAPDVMTYQGTGWQFSSAEADLSLGAGASTFSGELSLLVANSMIYSQQAEVLRDDKRQTEKITLQNDVAWLHQSWRLLVDELTYYPATQQIQARDARFMLFTKTQGRPWGAAGHVVSDDPHRISLEDAVITTCKPDNKVWSVRGKRMRWNEQTRHLLVEGARFYWYKSRLLYLGAVSFVDGEQTRGWLMPRVAFFDGDGVQIGRPYRFAYWPRTYDLMPFVNTRGGMGLQFNYQQHPQGEEQLGVIKVMHRGYLSPQDRAVGFYAGEHTVGQDARVKWQVMQASDGLFAQQIARDVGIDFFRPNQDLTSFLSWDRPIGQQAYGVAALQTQQRFSGDKWSIDLYSLPHFDVLPVVWMSSQLQKPGWLYQWQADNLRLLSPSAYDYPEAQRLLGYVGYQKEVLATWYWQLGAWLKSRHIENDTIFSVPMNRTFVVPNVELRKMLWHSASKNLALSYHYTAYVAQNDEPLFTTKNWYWRDQAYPNYLISMDRIFDRNAFKLHWQDDRVFQREGFSFDWYHTFSLSQRRVTVTPSGEEDPVVQYPYGVSSFLLGDVSTGLDLALLVVWPEQAVQAFSLRFPWRGVQLFWQQGPGEVIWEDNAYSMPFTRKVGLSLPFSLGLRWGNTLEIAYEDSLDKYLYMKNTIHYTGCCWEGSLFVTKNRILSVYDENAASPQDNLMLGLQLSLRGL